MEEKIESLNLKTGSSSKKKILLISGIAGLVLVLLVILLFLLFQSNSNTNKNLQPETDNKSNEATYTPTPTSPNSQNTVMWRLTESGWQASGDAPKCPDPFDLNPPVDLSEVTSILYPGQTRGGNYKPHGGFRFDNIKNNEAEVTVPMDATVVQGAQFLVDGEIQYTFDFIMPCGIMYRLGHLRVLDPKFQTIADTFPAAQEGDSRTTMVNPPVSVQQGEVIATKIGITKDGNTFVDFGVYDLKSKNEASQNPTWASQHTSDLEQRAVCWFDLLSTADEATVRSLPAGDPTSGKTSDYCK